MTREDERPRRPTVKRGPPRDKRPAGPPARTSAHEGERVAKIMARAGLCSRRDAEAWIEAGRVAVNGVTLKDAAKNVTPRDTVTVDGAPLAARERTRLFLFHKPRGLVTTVRDPEGRQTVFDYLAQRHARLPRLVSIGRLDINTEGLLLLTNDGGLARVLELPATGWLRRYRVRAHGAVTPDALAALARGVSVEGVDYAPIEATLDRVQGANVWLTMGLREGKNREIKRILDHLGLGVTRLIRMSYGPFQLGEMPEGMVEEVRTKVLMDQLGPMLIAQARADFSTPIVRDDTPAPERPVGTKRKHVSVIRKERDAQAQGPRVRIERSATQDRRGRAVAVERIAPAGAKEKEEAPTRNARRFRNERDGDRDARRSERPDGPRGARPGSRDAGGGARHDDRRPAREARSGDRPDTGARHGAGPRSRNAPGRQQTPRPPRRDGPSKPPRKPR
jgi:23S rRNA pseudouridine2605 synthase